MDEFRKKLAEVAYRFLLPPYVAEELTRLVEQLLKEKADASTKK